jgi:frataxin-like iron-binding protein CyaY
LEGRVAVLEGAEVRRGEWECAKTGQTIMNEVQVKVIFEKVDSVPTDILVEVLSEIEKQLYKEEVKDLELLGKEIREIPASIIDAARYRIRRYEGRLLNVDRTERGSFIIAASMGALALWIVQNTIGETFKEAWTESAFHERLKKFFASRLTDKLEAISSGIENSKRKRKTIADETRTLVIHANVNIVEKVVFVHVEGSSLRDVPPRYSQVDLHTPEDDHRVL